MIHKNTKISELEYMVKALEVQLESSKEEVIFLDSFTIGLIKTTFIISS